MTSPGKILSAARAEKNLDLATIASQLCVAERYLVAIEKDDVNALPGAFFYRNFARQYAEIVGVSATYIREALDAFEAPEAAKESLLFQSSGRKKESVTSIQLGQAGRLIVGLEDGVETSTPVEVSSGPIRLHDPWVKQTNQRYFPERQVGFWLASLGAVLLACSGFFAWWTSPKHATPVARSTPGAVTSSASTAANITPVSNTGSQPSAVDVMTTTSPDGVSVELRLSATEKTWVSVTSEGKVLFSGVLEPSQTKTLTGIEAAKMRVGNAGGIDVQWKGKRVGPIGPRGQVRTVVLDPDHVEILPPAPL